MKKHSRLGELLLASNLITEEQLRTALQEQATSRRLLGEILVDRGYVSDVDIAKCLSEQLGVPFVDLDTYQVDPEVVGLVPEATARAYEVMPLFAIEGKLSVAISDPLDIRALDVLHQETGYEIEPVISSRSAIRRALDQHYGTKDAMQEILRDMSEEDLETDVDEAEVERLQDLVDEAPVVKLVNNLLIEGVREGASDLHVEPDTDLVRIRFRLDGRLHEMPSIPKSLQFSVIARIKVIAKLDIANRRIPQDGRFEVTIDGKDIGVRVSTFPTIYGENVVMRLLDKNAGAYGFERLGLDERSRKLMEAMITKPYGMVLATGPTGSGKTTTLYALLTQVSSIEKNIITIEDPVEYRLPLVRQCQVNPKAGVTFATGLRSIVRQDPDVVMVGEIRDVETASIAVQAAMTGHLVFSTFHANDAPGAMARLIDMEIEPFLLGSAIVGILAQRLVRTLCPSCRTAYTPTDALWSELGLDGSNLVQGDPADHVFYRATGCRECRETGYKGRIPIFEIMPVSEPIRELVVSRASADQIRREAQKEGMKTLREYGLQKAIQGVTSVEEVLAWTQEI